MKPLLLLAALALSEAAPSCECQSDCSAQRGIGGQPLVWCESTQQCVDQACVDCCPVCTDAGCTP